MTVSVQTEPSQDRPGMKMIGEPAPDTSAWKLEVDAAQVETARRTEAVMAARYLSVMVVCNIELLIFAMRRKKRSFVRFVASIWGSGVLGTASGEGRRRAEWPRFLEIDESRQARQGCGAYV